ncbi:peptidylprolyl isomerase [Nocardioides zeae]|uniref:Peptidylprolyl isomerase n=1 Tax=Nocardioides zeae TaxID=1457234 RepID=A0A6P0HH55_9ACTN|nr:peptidyl-prolyl cis-trans isomerase [Nocardioides zeae]NEN77866.1 peptidylprolyl isomerase [Nocardioides zeae]
MTSLADLVSRLRRRALPPERQRVPALLAAGALVVGSVTVTAMTWDRGLPDDALLAVGEEVVTEEALDERIEVLRALYQMDLPEDDGAREELRRGAAKAYATAELIADAAADRGIDVSDKEVGDELDRIVDERLAGDRSLFVDWLSEQGITEDDVRDEIERTMTTYRLMEQVVADVPAATAEEAQAEYTAREDEMRTAEQRSLRNIVVETRDQAEAVRDRIAGGEDFAAVAREVSRDASTAASGGDLGTYAAADLDPAFAVAAFGAEDGALFGPVESAFGWNVGQVTAVVPGEPLAFEQVRDTLVEALTARAQLAVWQDFVGGLLEDGDVEYAAGYEPDDPTAPPSNLPPAAGATDPGTDPQSDTGSEEEAP